MRVLSGLLAGRRFLSVLDGDESLRRRPMARVVEPLRAMGATIDARADGTMAPIVVRGGALTGRRHTPAVASAQVKSALVLAGLQATGTTEIDEPMPSRDHTERMLAALGAPVTTTGDGTVRVVAGGPHPFDLAVPGDPSSAAFFVVAACITPGSEIVLVDVSLNPSRIAFVDVLRRMGADIEVSEREVRIGEPVGDISVRAAPLARHDDRGRRAGGGAGRDPGPGGGGRIRRGRHRHPRRGRAAREGERPHRHGRSRSWVSSVSQWNRDPTAS